MGVWPYNDLFICFLMMGRQICSMNLRKMRGWESNHGSLVSKATPLPIEPPPVTTDDLFVWVITCKWKSRDLISALWTWLCSFRRNTCNLNVKAMITAQEDNLRSTEALCHATYSNLEIFLCSGMACGEISDQNDLEPLSQGLCFLAWHFGNVAF